MPGFPANTEGERQMQPGEVQAHLVTHSHVKDALVVVREEEPGGKRWIAYVVPADDAVSSIADSAGTGRSCLEHVAGWQRLYDHTYQRPRVEDPAFDITGWNSTYTGEPIPENEMREWVERTAERIALRGGRRVLEIGCGTGLLLARLAGSCEVYTATDFSSVALDRVRRLIGQRNDLRHVELMQRAAENFEGIACGGYDTVILNSVVQYFPSIEYLRTVLERAVAVLQPGGRIFLGDVRNLALLRALHASVRCHREPDDVARLELVRRVDHDVGSESELVVDPDFFVALTADDTRIGDVEILMKRGHCQNELTRFRYDVFMNTLATDRVPLPESWLDWKRDRLTIVKLEKMLAEQPAQLGVRGVPNARLASTVLALDWLEREGDGPEGLRQFRTAAPAPADYLEPEALWSLAERSGYVLECGYAEEGACFDALFVDRRLAGNPRKVLWGRTSGSMPRPWRTYANMPLKAQLVRELTPRLREHLDPILPRGMEPLTFVFVDELPTTAVAAGSLLLPAHSDEATDTAVAAPSRPLETQLARLWAQVLNVDSVGIHDDFFDLGGDSFMAVKLVSLIQSELGWKTSVMEMFDHPTVASLAELAEDTRCCDDAALRSAAM